jgi:uncharacterized cupin superfamily protein
MKEIKVERPDEETVERMGVRDWPVWEKEVSRFDWHYSERETCYVLEGEVRVEPEEGEAVEFGPGDLVTFPEGMACVWEVKRPIRKHYRFG